MYFNVYQYSWVCVNIYIYIFCWQIDERCGCILSLPRFDEESGGFHLDSKPLLITGTSLESALLCEVILNLTYQG